MSINGVSSMAFIVTGVARRARASKLLLVRQQLNAGESATLLPDTTYKFAIMLIHGDGDLEVQLVVTVGGNTYTLSGDEQAIEVLANESTAITAKNTDTQSPHYAPTIEIAHLAW
jgi:hypothetical protein